MNPNNYDNIKKISIPFVEIIAKVISFINVLLLMKIINIEEYADYAYVLNLTLWVSLFMDFGISNLIYNKALQKIRKGISEFVIMRVVISFFVLIIFILIIYLLKREFFIISFIISGSIFFTSISYLFKMLARGLGIPEVDIRIIITEPLIKLIILLFILFTINKIHYSFVNILVILLLVASLSFVLNLSFLNKFFKLDLYFSKSFHFFREVKQSFIESNHFFLYTLAFYSIVRMDNFFLEINSTKTELATFSSAYSLYQTAQLFFFALITSQMILLIKNYKYFFVFLLPLVVLAIFTVYIFSPFIYDYLFKVEYNGGEHLLNILILALIPSVFNFYCITKNNYYDRVVNNIYILTIVFLMKFSVYLLIHPDSAIEYIYVIIITESVISVSFIVQSLIRLNKITVYENTSG